MTASLIAGATLIVLSRKVEVKKNTVYQIAPWQIITPRRQISTRRRF